MLSFLRKRKQKYSYHDYDFAHRLLDELAATLPELQITYKDYLDNDYIEVKTGCSVLVCANPLTLAIIINVSDALLKQAIDLKKTALQTNAHERNKKFCIPCSACDIRAEGNEKKMITMLNSSLKVVNEITNHSFENGTLLCAADYILGNEEEFKV